MSYFQGLYGKIMVLILFLQICPLYGNWFGGFFSSSSTTSTSENEKKPSGRTESFPGNNVAEFSLELFTNQKGVKMLENARNQIADVSSTNSCRKRAYSNLLFGCSKTLADEESRNRFSWDLTGCFLQHTGRNGLPRCDPKSTVSKCLKTVDQQAVSVYLEYHMETNNICYQLQ